MNPCILVFGLPRSGTTWVGKLFDSHPLTLYRHEPDSVRRLSLPLYPERGTALQYRSELECFMDALPGMRSPEVVGKEPLFPKSYQSSAALHAYRASVIAAKAASRIRRHFPCPFRPTGRGHDHARLVWKSIESSGRLGVLMDALPDARAIYLIRHPCGYIASQLRGQATHQFSTPGGSLDDRWVLRLLLATEAGKACGLALDDIMHLTQEERLAWRWVLTHETVLADVADNSRVLTVCYEDFCAEPLAMTRKVLEFTGLHWQSQTEAFVHASTRTARNWRQTGYYSVFKNPGTSAERWRSELAPEVVARIMHIFRRSPVARFYERCTDASAGSPGVAERRNKQ